MEEDRSKKRTKRKKREQKMPKKFKEKNLQNDILLDAEGMYESTLQ